jgi:hypothetical protein
MPLRILRILFSKDSAFRACLGLRDPFDHLSLAISLHIPIGCVKPAVAMEPVRVYKKDIFILYSIFYYVSISIR